MVSTTSKRSALSRISVPPLKYSGGDIVMRWDMTIATNSTGGGRSVASGASRSTKGSKGSSKSKRSGGSSRRVGSARVGAAGGKRRSGGYG